MSLVLKLNGVEHTVDAEPGTSGGRALWKRWIG